MPIAREAAPASPHRHCLSPAVLDHSVDVCMPYCRVLAICAISHDCGHGGLSLVETGHMTLVLLEAQPLVCAGQACEDAGAGLGRHAHTQRLDAWPRLAHLQAPRRRGLPAPGALHFYVHAWCASFSFSLIMALSPSQHRFSRGHPWVAGAGSSEHPGYGGRSCGCAQLWSYPFQRNLQVGESCICWQQLP